MPSGAALTSLTKLGAIASATVAAASVTYVAMNSTSTDQQQPAANGAIVCVGADAALRHVAAGEACPPDQQRLTLSIVEDEGPEWDEGDKDSPPTTEKNDAKAPTPAELEKRLRDLEEKKPLFEVVDGEGNPIFTVTPETVRVYDDSSTVAATIRATDEGGFFTAHSGGYAASLGASGSRGGVRITEGGVVRADLGRQDTGNHALRFPSPARGVFAAIGESRGGTGALVIANAAGLTKAMLTADEGKGAAGIFNDGGAAVASLTEGATQGGLLAIGDASSNPMVKMGVQDNRYGIVLTGPKAGFPYIPATGLPGSYFIGCAADCGPGGK